MREKVVLKGATGLKVQLRENTIAISGGGPVGGGGGGGPGGRKKSICHLKGATDQGRPIWGNSPFKRAIGEILLSRSRWWEWRKDPCLQKGFILRRTFRGNSGQVNILRNTRDWTGKDRGPRISMRGKKGRGGGPKKRGEGFLWQERSRKDERERPGAPGKKRGRSVVTK